MEVVLDVYQRPYDPKHPVVCMDEASKQLLADVFEPLPAKPGHMAKEDSNYERHGTCNLFVAFEPMCGWRDVTVTDRRTKCDWADYVKQIVDEMYSDAERITLVCDQLNTHTLASLYEAFEPQEAHRLARKLEIIHTPKHGSWLNIVETLFGKMARSFLRHIRVQSLNELKTRILKGIEEINAAPVVHRWKNFEALTEE